MVMQYEASEGRHGVWTPGIPILPAGVERYPIAGGGSYAVSISEGDEITVVDRDGLQPAELVFFAGDGRSDAAMLGRHRHANGNSNGNGNGDASQLHATLHADSSGKKILHALDAAGFALTNADPIVLFADGSHAGDSETLTAQCDGLLIAAAVGRAMQPDAQNTLSEIILYIKRATLPAEANTRPPPAPLADPLQDFNIQPGQATAYEVRAGDYIQIVDVQGRECSDFQAFSLRGLERGDQCDIDPTTTRSLNGMLYPLPGLLAKYYSQEHEPLVEIVQDTCGRHDTFGLACTARYYEDMGYPGHINCSDNINASMARYHVRARAGWPAINFFFNTALDATHAILLDDPWSRPGDYVLLRALSDLVCVSTACPCDIDAANGWNPTDIQVRTYPKTRHFARAVARRKTPEADMETTKETGFHPAFARHTRDFVEYNGYWLPQTMTQHGTVGEYWACRERVAVMDLSPLRKYEVTGPDAEALLQKCVTRDVKKLSDGQVVYTAMCYEHGGMVDDGTIYRLGANNFRWVGGSDDSGEWLKKHADGLNVWVRPSTAQLCNIAVQGRHSRALLASVLWTPPKAATIDELRWFRWTPARVGGFHGAACVVSRTGYSGELGYEIFCHPKDAEAVFAAVWAAGEPHSIAPLGLAALDMLRIEAGLVFAGTEFCDQTDPFEAGIGFTVALQSTEDDFTGRAALTERKAHPQRQLVGLEIEGGVVPASGDCLHLGGDAASRKVQIGEITSAVKSPILGKVIALARVAAVHAASGTAVEVGQLDGQQKRLRATIVPFPHFDPQKSRVRGIYEA